MCLCRFGRAAYLNKFIYLFPQYLILNIVKIINNNYIIHIINYKYILSNEASCQIKHKYLHT